ncbi:MAG: hypothetical protein GTO60_03290, partial [Gammaproteobacteria bacterium]|nr:hypothetical protein [Gammaproteobacteria bacterium]NIO62441.1 hypothetical protein [Gammaproteobacteria bacterium]
MRVSADGGQARQLITITGNEQYAWPSVLPDGQHVMYNLANPDNQTTSIIIENLNSGEQWKVIENGSYPRFLPG